jgi:hypothetical protein
MQPPQRKRWKRISLNDQARPGEFTVLALTITPSFRGHRIAAAQAWTENGGANAGLRWLSAKMIMTLSRQAGAR